MPESFDIYFAAHHDAVEASRTLLGPSILTVGAVLRRALSGGRKVLTFGNGGSAAQAAHLAGELLGRFSSSRAPWPAVALSADAATVTCIGNDFGFDHLFARQVEALARPGDVVIGLTTSGRSANVLAGLAEATRQRAVTVALTGSGGLGGGSADYVLAVPATATGHVQEVHLMILHYWCVLLEGAEVRENIS